MWGWLVISVALGALGQIFMSIAMKAAGAIPKTTQALELIKYYFGAAFSLPMMGAVLCYGVSFVLWLGVLSKKDLSLARPLMSMGYLITLAWGVYAGENVTAGRILGTALIITGIFFVVKSDML